MGRAPANGATAALVSGAAAPGGNGEGKVPRNGAVPGQLPARVMPVRRAALVHSGAAGGPLSNRVAKVVQGGKVRADLGGPRVGVARGEVRQEATRKRTVARAEMGKSPDVAGGPRSRLPGW